MGTLLETHGAIITLDKLPIGQAHNPHHFLLNWQGQSTDYALTHGGYGIETRENVIRGYMDYLTIAGRRGYGVNGWVVRSIENLQAVSLQGEPDLTNDAFFTDEIALPTLKGIRAALNYTDGALSAINGELDAWVMTCAARFGIPEDSM
jgi:hypothetical protein